MRQKGPLFFASNSASSIASQAVAEVWSIGYGLQGLLPGPQGLGFRVLGLAFGV